MIRYDMTTLTPLQAIVSIDETGDFTLLYEPITDPLLRRVLAYRRYLPLSPSTSPPLPSLLHHPLFRKLYTSLPFAANLSQPDFIPTKAVHFLERLREKLPSHRLLVADFDQLPEAVEGRNGPVVQTRYGGSMVPCETFLVKQGYFDIFFPTGMWTLELNDMWTLELNDGNVESNWVETDVETDFELLRDTYAHIMNSPPPSASTSTSTSTSLPTPTSPPSRQNNHSKTPPTHSPSPTPTLDNDFFSSTGVKGFRRRQVNIHTHAEFLERYAGSDILRATTLRDGGSVMLGMYRNAKVMF